MYFIGIQIGYVLYWYAEFKHIYRERNAKTYDLAKAGENIQNGYWHIYEFQGIERYDNCQPFRHGKGLFLK